MTTRPRTFLPEVQALRALAVMLVVGYHFWPARLQGGYVGVDVFLVISGFLITSHLHRELLSSGTVSLRAFYARRARRLLPASLLVLLVATVASWVLLPMTRWASSAKEVLASTFYVQNWLLADRAVDYSALSDEASPVQHFWSLSVEEQFYIGWPTLLLLLAVTARRSRRVTPFGLVLPGTALVTLLSLAYSVHATARTPAAAYFVTPTRTWELGVGAVLALWMGNRVHPLSWHAPMRSGHSLALRWTGLLAIGAAALLFSSASPFPGYLAMLPVLGTAAVIAAGATTPGDPLGRLFESSPVQFLGVISYSLYLWHWPAFVIAPFVVGHLLHWPEKLALLGLSIVLACLTKLLVEDSAQKWRRLSTRPLLTGFAALLAMTAVAGVAGLQLREVALREDAARASLVDASLDPCFGAPALDDRGGCGDPFGPAVSTSLPPEDQPWYLDPACQRGPQTLKVVLCRFGDGPPTRRVALVGDSHAEHWRAALHRIAKAQHWELVEVLHGGCPVIEARVLTFNGNATNTEECYEWGQQTSEFLAADPPDYIFTSSFASAYTFDAGEGDPFEAGTDGYVDAWTRWTGLGSTVFVLQDIPTTAGRNVPECVATNPAEPAICSLGRDLALPPDPARTAASRSDDSHIRSVDLTDRFCDERSCHAVVGGVPVYWDVNHMSASFSRSLAPYVLDDVLRTMNGS